MKPRLLIVELWGLGDLVIATPFIRAAAQRYAVTLLAKPFAAEMRHCLWPEVEVISFVAPWTAFRFGSKYALWHWPWAKMLSLSEELRTRDFDCAVSGRWDPRDHLLLQATGARERLGFPRLQSGRCLTKPLPLPDPLAHRSEYWRVIASSLGLRLPTREEITPPARPPGSMAFIHSGARLPARVWPLANFRGLARRLRARDIAVRIACDPNQIAWWQEQGETAACPRNVGELFKLMDDAGIFIGNCSGPGHLAAISGVPTFTIYGPSLPEWWAPLHPAAEWIEGKACPYKPCSDYCHFPTPECLWKISEEEAWQRIQQFASRHLAAKGLEVC
ncbi:MAG TPA: glycosyltransferase family 9 protein [Candidatus Acidoferrales bacterium]|nr:glycosyltransferase family 9 protein [Candidatus Acidoferrales bacterium]